jgi:hypothetical protein
MFDPLVTAQNFFKTYYRPGFVQNAINQKASQGFTLVPKDTAGEGKTYNFLVDVDAGDSAGGSDLAISNDALNTDTSVIGSQFSMPYMNTYVPFGLSGQAIAASRSDKGAYVKALKYVLDTKLLYFGHLMSIYWHGQGWGELAQATSVSGATFKCLDPAHIYRFRKGMKLVGAASLHSDALRSGTAITVTAVDYTANLVTCDTALATPGITNNDWVFINGDRQNSSTPTMRVPLGFKGWIPDRSTGSVDTALVTIGGISRASNSLLYGFWIDGTAQSLSDAFKQAVQTVATVGHADDVMIGVAPAKYTDLAAELGSDKRIVNEEGKTKVGFATITVVGDGGTARVYADLYQGSHEAHVMDRKAFVHFSMGPAPRTDTDDGREFLRQTDTDAIVGRYKAYHGFACVNPPACAYVSLT